MTNSIREIVTVQAGQCGNQIGQEFWNQLCKEHAINPVDGTDEVNKDTKPREDYPNTFFNEDENNRFTPRGILFDLEPRVIGNISNRFPNLFNPRNLYTSPQGNGAGNNWAQGYEYANNHVEELINIIDREVDNCDNLEAFQLVHSVAGGTGSGLGSYILENLNDRYEKKLINTFSIFPANDQTSDVVVQPYNTILTLRRLIEFSDSCIVFDNGALNSIAHDNLRINDISFEQTNQLVSTVMSSFTNPLRFPTSMYNSMSSILSTLIPTPNLHFLIPSFYPFTNDFIENNNLNSNIRRSSSTYDVLLNLLDKNFKMIKINDKYLNNEKYFTILNFLQGSIDKTMIEKSLNRYNERINFPNWLMNNNNINLIYGKKSSYIINNNEKILNGLMLSNSTSVVSLFKKNCFQYDKLIKRNAFLDGYKKTNLFLDNLDEFYSSREIIENLIEEYTLAGGDDYLNDDDDNDEDLIEEDESV